MSEFKRCLIGDIAKIIGGGTPSTKNEENFGGKIGWITPKDLSDHNEMFISQGERSITETGLKNSSARLLPANSILFTSRAPIGYIALAKNEITTNQGFKSLILKDENVPEFFYYLMKHNTPKIESFASGSTFKEVSGSVLKSIEVDIPNVKNQKAIAHMLGTLDDKIELNQNMNQNLEETTKAIFKSWFVDFDPVRAKVEGRPTGLPPEIGGLFPDEMVDSEIGEIPTGWDIRGLDHYLLLQRGFDLPSKDRIEGDFPVVAASGISSTHNFPKAKAPGVVTGRSGVLGNVFFVQQDFFPLNTTLWVKEFYAATPVFAYFLLRTIDFAVFNAGSAVPTLNRNHLSSLRFPSPQQKLIDQFTKITTPLMESLDLRTKESSTLEQIRDTLLPKLISGELRIPDAEKFLEEAGI